jgi:hypothetical protein
VGHHLDTVPPALARTRPELAPLDPVLAVGLAKVPSDRFARCADFARAFSDQIGAVGSAPSHADRFTEPLTVAPRTVAPRRKRFHAIPVLAGVAVVAVVASAIWLLWPSSNADDPSGANASPPPVANSELTEAQKTLRGILPPGYDKDACTAADTPQAAVAMLSCTRNADAGGPPSATYTLFPDVLALRGAFDAEVRRTRVVNCPGNIQSPGPWRRNATPQQVSGTLACGFRDDVPEVSWTDDDELLLSSVKGAEDGPNLDQLYVWWSSHS